MPTITNLSRLLRNPPRYRTHSTAGTTASGTSLTIPVPSGIMEGDLLIMGVNIRGGSNNTGFAVTGGGWTSLLSQNQGPSLQMNILYRRASNEPSNYVTTWTNAANVNAAGFIYAALGWDLVAPTLVSQANTGTPTAATAPTITPSKLPSLLLFIAGCNSGTTYTPDPQMIERIDVRSTSTASNEAITLNEQVWRTASPTGSRTATQAGGANNIAALVSINRG